MPNELNIFSQKHYLQAFNEISPILIPQLNPQIYTPKEGLFSQLSWDDVWIFQLGSPLICPLQIQTWHASIRAAHGEVFIDQVPSFYLLYEILKKDEVSRVYIFGMPQIVKNWASIFQLPGINKLMIIEDTLKNWKNIRADIIILNGKNTPDLFAQIEEIEHLRDQNIQGRIRYEGQERVLYEMALEKILLIPEIEDLVVIDHWDKLKIPYNYHRKYRRDDLIVFFHILNSYEREASDFYFEEMNVI